jgi:hypothetical protein
VPVGRYRRADTLLRHYRKSVVSFNNQNCKTYTVTPMTAASCTAGCSSNNASSSAGATCSPLTLINSYTVSIESSPVIVPLTFFRSTMKKLFSSST